jgi:hypothetical protein
MIHLLFYSACKQGVRNLLTKKFASPVSSLHMTVRSIECLDFVFKCGCTYLIALTSFMISLQRCCLFHDIFV